MKYYDMVFYVVLLAPCVGSMSSFGSEEATKALEIRASGRSSDIDSSQEVVYEEKPSCVGTFSHLAPVTSARFNKRCDRIVTITPSNGLAYVWDVRGNSYEPHLVYDHNKERPINAWFRVDGKYIFTQTKGQKCWYAWSTKDGTPRGKRLLAEISRQADYSSDSCKLEYENKVVRIIDQETTKTVQEITHPDRVTSARWNRDGTRIASSAGNFAYVWCVGKTVQEIQNKEHNKRILEKAKYRGKHGLHRKRSKTVVAAFTKTFGS